MKTVVVIKANEFSPYGQAVHVAAPPRLSPDEDVELMLIRKVVKARLKDAGGVLVRCPQPPELSKLYGAGGSWPQIIHSRNDQGAWRGVRLCPTPPTAEEISRMEEVLGWLLWLDDGPRPIVFACMFFGFRKVARRGQKRCSHETVRRTYERGISIIAGRLLEKMLQVS